MKFNYLLVIMAFVSSPLFAQWADANFPNKLIQRYPAYRQQIERINKEMSFAWQLLTRDPKSPIARNAVQEKTKELADLICQAARAEIFNQVTEESEFVIINK